MPGTELWKALIW